MRSHYVRPSLGLVRRARRRRTAARRPPPLRSASPTRGWRGDFKQAARKLDAFKAVGFRLVAFVPNYAYVGLDRIDLASGPDAAELGERGRDGAGGRFPVVIKPHLDPPAYQPGFDQFQSENGSWRVACPWRGFFDVDPMTLGLS